MLCLFNLIFIISYSSIRYVWKYNSQLIIHMSISVVFFWKLRHWSDNSNTWILLCFCHCTCYNKRDNSLLTGFDNNTVHIVYPYVLAHGIQCQPKQSKGAKKDVWTLMPHLYAIYTHGNEITTILLCAVLCSVLHVPPSLCCTVTHLYPKLYSST